MRTARYFSIIQLSNSRVFLFIKFKETTFIRSAVKYRDFHCHFQPSFSVFLLRTIIAFLL